MVMAIRAACLALAGMGLAACSSAVLQTASSPQGSGPQGPARPVSHVAAYVVGPNALAASFQADIAVEAARRGLASDNAAVLFPPTHAYAEAEIRQGLATRAIDSVIIIKIGDAGGARQYAGTILQDRSPASAGPTAAAIASINGDPHSTAFTARLVDAASGRALWNGDGQIAAGGLSYFSYGTNVEDAVTALFDDMQEKGLIASAN